MTDQNVKPVDWLIAGPMIDTLRAPEGAMVQLGCDNADFNGLPDCVITVSDDWTGYVEVFFRADTLVDCLRLALAAAGVLTVDSPPA